MTRACCLSPYLCCRTRAWRKYWFVLRSRQESSDPGFLEYYKNARSKKPLRIISLCHCEQVDAGVSFDRKICQRDLCPTSGSGSAPFTWWLRRRRTCVCGCGTSAMSVASGVLWRTQVGDHTWPFPEGLSRNPRSPCVRSGSHKPSSWAEEESAGGGSQAGVGGTPGAP